jgi:hypothetical protein
VGVYLGVTRKGSQIFVTISGIVDETANFDALVRLTGRIRIDLSGVVRFNSLGSRNWIDAVRALAAQATITFAACSPAVVHLLNTTYGFLAHSKVESFIGAMLCASCEREFEHVFDTRECVALDGLPEVRCPLCGGPSTLDDDPEQYLLFLREPTGVEQG